MREKLNDRVSVVCFYSARQHTFRPHTISWQGREYKVGEIGFAHKYRDGDTLHHIFEVVDQNSSMAFRLNFNTKELHWTLEAVSDGLAA